MNKGKLINIQSEIVLKPECDVSRPRKFSLRSKQAFSLHGIWLHFKNTMFYCN